MVKCHTKVHGIASTKLLNTNVVSTNAQTLALSIPVAKPTSEECGSLQCLVTSG